MHGEAKAFVERVLAHIPPRHVVCEFGSYNVNGGVRDLFIVPAYVGVDMRAGKGVDVVADCADWTPPDDVKFDCVVTTEMLEHAPRPKEAIANAYRLLCPGGVLILTAAAWPRPAHTSDASLTLKADDFYHNVGELELRQWLREAGFLCPWVEVHRDRGDIYCWAVK